jgi:hypothetical protein
VPRNRLLAEEELGGDAVVGLAGGDQAQHFDLTWAEPACRRSARAPMGEPVQPGNIGSGAQLLEHLPRCGQLNLCGVLVAELLPGQPQEHARARIVVGRLERTPRRARLAEHDESSGRVAAR